MPLRTKLLLSLVLTALIPLILFGVTAYQVSTTNLMNIERDNLEGALDSTDRALADIQNGLAKYLRDYTNWDDLHDQAVPDAPDPEWVKANLDPSSPTSTYNNLGLSLLGLWNASNKLSYSAGPVADLAPQLDATMQKAITKGDPVTTLMSVGQDIYVVALAPIHKTDGTDPKGLLLFGRKMGAAEVEQVKALTGFDVALYKDLQQIAATQNATVTPAPGELKSAAAGNKIFIQNDPNVALAYKPVQDDAGNNIMTIVVWRPRSAVIAAQTSIAGTLAVVFGLGILLAVIVALLVGRSIAQPLLAMANSADKMAAGDLTQRVVAPSRARDELSRLAAAFNQMASKVGARVTESETEKERLKAIDEYRLNLLTAITQALQTPLTTVRNHSEALEMAQYGQLNDAQRRSAGAIHRAAAVQEALLADLLDFAKAQQKQLRINRERVSLSGVVKDLSSVIEQRNKDKRVQLVQTIPDDLPPLFADRIRVEQILDHVLGYAFDFSVPGGRVELTAVDKQGTVAVSISDMSNGLSAEDKTKLFDLFYHPNGNGNGSSGNGLGLAFVKALLEQQGGTISVDVKPGKGNTFTFTLPATNY
jgi:signal transduction histidine kinase/sensor domain CHASE-containing protein